MTQHDGRYDRETCAHSPEYSCDIECDLRAIAISRATQLEQMRRERDEARSDRDAMAQEMGDARADLAEARATNARLHRRAQGVDARSPDDADLIRRLRADVRGQAKYAGYVTGHVYRLQMAANFARHATSEAVRERDEARAKLARVRDAAVRYHMSSERALRIIDEKEGGQ